MGTAAAKGSVGAACSKGAGAPLTDPYLHCRSTEERMQRKSYILKVIKKLIVYFRNISFPLQVEVLPSAKVGKIALQVDVSPAPKSGR